MRGQGKGMYNLAGCHPGLESHSIDRTMSQPSVEEMIEVDPAVSWNEETTDYEDSGSVQLSFP
jgi:hypothetical protein